MRPSPSHLALLGLVACAGGAAAGCPAAPPPPPPRVVAPPPPPPTPLPETQADGRLPRLATPTHYTLHFDVDPREPRFSATARIDIQLPERSSYVVLHGHGLHVTQARGLTASESVPAVASTRTAKNGTSAEELVLAFERPLPAGHAVLALSWDAPFDDELSGLYRVKEGDRWYAFTQFEATDARRAFPCFDEPTFKVPFDVSVTAPKDMLAIANARETTRSEAGNRVTYHFAETPPLPSYLVALAVGEFDVVESAHDRDPKIRLITTRGKSALGNLALDATGALVDGLGQWFSIPYPYDKLDIVAVPDFSAGAMENPGLVTFREELLLLDPARASIRARRSQALTIAHELAHQWFGNYVTATWWNDLWLNEGFATWMEWRAVDAWQPSFAAGVDAVASGLEVMDQDALASARAVRQPVVSTSDAQEAFDGITYAKGAAVIGTIERWVGAETFQRGVRDYLKENAFKSVEASRLFSALDRASGKNVTAMASTFLDRPGVPEVSAKLMCDRGRWHVELNQEPWRPLGSRAKDEERAWVIPVCVRAQGEKKDTCADLAAGAPSIVAGSGHCPSYVHPNATGNYYRFSVAEAEYVKLAEAKASFDVPGRLSVLSNAWAAVRAGKLKPEGLTKVLAAFDDENARQVVEEVVSILGSMNEALVDDDAQPAFERFVTARLAKRKKALGWAPKAGEAAGSDEAMLRRTVIAGLGELAHDETTLREAEEHATRWLADPTTVDANIAGVALDLASRRADATRLQALRDAARNAKTREDRILALRAMMGFDAPEVLEQALGLVLTDEVRPHEMRYTLGAAFGRKRTRTIAEAWVRGHWDELRKKLPGALGGTLVHAVVGCSKAELDARAAFYGPKVADIEGAPRRLAEALESIALCAELREHSAEPLGKVLKKK